MYTPRKYVCTVFFRILHLMYIKILMINFDCVCAPSIHAQNSESTSPCTTLDLRSLGSETRSAHWVPQLDPGCCCRDRSLEWFLISYCLASLNPILSISFSCYRTLARSCLKSKLVNVALIRTIFLYSFLALVKRCYGQWLSQSLLHLIQNLHFLLQCW